MPRSDAQTSKAPFILPPKPLAEARAVGRVCRKFPRDSREGLSVEELLQMRRQLED